MGITREIANPVIAGLTVADADFGVVDEIDVLHELLLAQAPCESCRREITPAVVLRELARSVVAERCGEEIAVFVVVIDASEVGHHAITRLISGVLARNTLIDATDAQLLVGDLFSGEAPFVFVVALQGPAQ